MASVQFYTQNATEGLQTYTLAEANLLEATKNTHYTENFLYKTTNPTTQEDVWSVNLTIPLAGMDYVSPSKNYQPLPHYQLTDHNGYFYPDYVDPSATALTSQPTDWELHWRDYYTENKFIYWDDNLKRYYYGAPLYPNASNVAPTWASGIFYKTNQVRHIYWTIDGNYFPLTWGWLDINNTVYYGLQFAWAQYGKYNVNWDAHWENVNNPRFAGVSGPLVYGNTGSGENYFSFLHNYGADTSLSSDIDPRVYFNFIGFKYKFMDTSGEEPVEKTEEFIGLIAWEESIDGIPQSAKIVGLSKNFFGARKKPANGGPISGVQGGNGTFSAPSNNRGDRNGATAAGIASTWGGSINTFSPGYNNYYLGSPDVAAFREMVESLWAPDVIQGFKNLMLSPINAIVCCHQVPANLAPTALGTSEHIQAAGVGLTPNHTVPTFSNWITHWHGGDINISEYTGSFADYTDTSIYIHLPYIGTQLLDTAACMDGWLAVDYLTDVISGECTALVTCCDRFGNTQIRYEFKGDCSRSVDLHQKVPASTRTLGAVIPAVLGGMVAGVTGAFVGASSLTSSLSQALQTMDPDAFGPDEAAAFLSNRNIQGAIGSYGVTSTLAGKSGSIVQSATAAALSGAATSSSNASGGNVTSPIDTQIWVMITRPQWSNPELYAREKAYPSDISGKVGDFTGFLSIQTAELNNIGCTDVERSEIMERLIAGVLLS